MDVRFKQSDPCTGSDLPLLATAPFPCVWFPYKCHSDSPNLLSKYSVISLPFGHNVTGQIPNTNFINLCEYVDSKFKTGRLNNMTFLLLHIVSFDQYWLNIKHFLVVEDKSDLDPELKDLKCSGYAFKVRFPNQSPRTTDSSWTSFQGPTNLLKWMWWVICWYVHLVGSDVW